MEFDNLTGRNRGWRGGLTSADLLATRVNATAGVLVLPTTMT